MPRKLNRFAEHILDVSACPSRLMGRLLAGLVLAMTGCATTSAPLRPPAVALGEPSFIRTLTAHTEAPVIPDNAVDPLLNGQEIFPAVLTAIRTAQTSVTYAQYYWADGAIGRTIAEALAERRRAGVDVKVLLDAVGTLGMPDEHAQILQNAGCDVAIFRPLATTPPDAANHRQHARLLIVDGRIGFTGGSGVARGWRGSGIGEDRWRETDVRVEGPAVAAMQAAFVRRWRDATGTMLGGPRYFPQLDAAGSIAVHVVDGRPWYGEPSLQALYVLAFAAARESILVSNPYFLPDAALRRALLDAVARGVRVSVLLPGKIDHRFVRRVSRGEFGPLLDAGVEIYEYVAAQLHAKTLVVDGALTVIGSANLDPRSLTLNAEVALVAHSSTVAERLTRAFAEDVRRSRRVTLGAWRDRPLAQRVLEWLLRPLRPQL